MFTVNITSNVFNAKLAISKYSIFSVSPANVKLVIAEIEFEASDNDLKNIKTIE